MTNSNPSRLGRSEIDNVLALGIGVSQHWALINDAEGALEGLAPAVGTQADRPGEVRCQFHLDEAQARGVRERGTKQPDWILEQIRALDDRRIRFVNRPHNGPYPADPAAHWMVQGTYPYNEAATLANGAWIAPLDDDDEWSDEHLELLLRAAQRHRAELVYGRMRAVIEGAAIETRFGGFPPRQGDFGFQTAMYHSALREFRYDSFAYLRDEVSDWNLARRMWESGVGFHFIDDVVGTHHVERTARTARWWLERARERGPLPAQLTGSSRR
jgi:hypothetical protein